MWLFRAIVERKMRAVEVATSLVLIWSTPANALDDLRQYAYVRGNSQDVALVDMKSDRIDHNVRFKQKPRSIYVIDDKKLLLSIHGPQIEVYDLAAEQMLPPITVDDKIDFFQYNSKAGIAAVANESSGRVSLIDLESRSVVGSVQELQQLSSIGFDRSGSELLVTRKSSQTIGVIDVKNPHRVDAFSLDAGQKLKSDERGGIRSLDKTPNGRFALALLEGSSVDVPVVNLNTRQIVKNVPIGKGYFDRAYSTADGAFMLLSSDRNRSVSLVSMASQSEVANFYVGSEISSVNTAWFETTAFAVDRADGNVIVIDLVNRQVSSVIHLPGQLGRSAVSPDGLKIFVPSSDTRSIAIIDARFGRLTGMISELPFAPEEVVMAGSIAFCH